MFRFNKNYDKAIVSSFRFHKRNVVNLNILILISWWYICRLICTASIRGIVRRIRCSHPVICTVQLCSLVLWMLVHTFSVGFTGYLVCLFWLRVLTLRTSRWVCTMFWFNKDYDKATVFSFKFHKRNVVSLTILIWISFCNSCRLICTASIRCIVCRIRCSHPGGVCDLQFVISA